MPIQTARYLIEPRRWRSSWKLLIPGIVVELAIVYVTSHNKGVLVGAIAVLSITLPMVLAVSREPGVGLALALTGSIYYAGWGNVAGGTSVNFGLIVVAWTLSTFIVAVTANHQHAQRRDLINRILRAEGEERARIASDLHDDTIQVMTAAVLAMDMMDVDVKRLPPFQRAHGLMKESVARLRSMSFQLRPPSLEKHGLQVALVELCDEYKAQFADQNATVTCHIDIPQRQAPFVEELVHRVALELLQNAWRHAHASKIELDAHTEGHVIHMSVTDNGVGFDPATQIDRRGHHLGLPAKIERVEWAGGKLTFDSQPGRTRISLVVPGDA